MNKTLEEHDRLFCFRQLCIDILSETHYLSVLFNDSPSFIKRKSGLARLRDSKPKVTPECIYGLLTLPTQNLTEKKV